MAITLISIAGCASMANVLDRPRGRSNGRMAQCTAHNKERVMPQASLVCVLSSIYAIMLQI